jgi:tetratricopeptide (TPR) repeat protein
MKTFFNRNSGYLVSYLGGLHLLVNRLEEGREYAQHALQNSQVHNERGHQAWALQLLGDITAKLEPFKVEETEIHYQQALTLANELGRRPLQAHCHRGLGKLYSQTGQAEQARAEMATAIEMYRDMEMAFWLPETEAALAEVEGR